MLSRERSRPSPAEGTERAGFRITAVALLVFGAGLAGCAGGRDTDAVTPGAPKLMSAEELRSYASQRPGLEYWLGEMPDAQLELTQTSRGLVFLRYLRGDAEAGDPRPLFTTVGTYPQRGAFALSRRASRRPGRVTRPVADGGIASWSRARPTSVYVTFPASDFLIEVYDPDERRARSLAMSGSLKPLL